MPLRAVVNKAVVSVFDYTDAALRKMQSEVRNGKVELTCLECGGQLQIRCIESDNTIAHFFHVGENKRNCITGNGDYFYHELATENLKLYLVESPLWDVAAINKEVEASTIGGAKNKRRIDVKVVGSDGSIVAHEVQLSYQPVSVIQERTSDYSRSSIQAVWWLGEQFNDSYITQIEKLGIRWGKIELNKSDYVVKFIEPNEFYNGAMAIIDSGAILRQRDKAIINYKDSFALPTEYGGTAWVARYDVGSNLYQSNCRSWWKFTSGVLVEVKRESSLSGIWESANAAYLAQKGSV